MKSTPKLGAYYEILSNDIETVEDMIDALMIAPKGYKFHKSH